jgi:hypothetical protein
VTGLAERAAEHDPERFVRMRTALGDQDEASIDLNEHVAHVILYLNGRGVRPVSPHGTSPRSTLLTLQETA